ncbi:hypothetical protein M3Y99_01700200 [Aphelenchoides fujianensis]|nr:hypothetical protein M3Y99_01700200 [Aphelenchoides fujianensis]
MCCKRMCKKKPKASASRHPLEKPSGQEGKSQSRRPADQKAAKSERKAKAPPPDGQDHSAERMAADNTLKEVAARMPECEFEHPAAVQEPLFTNDQLL